MLGRPTSWDTAFGILLGIYVICSAMLFLTLFALSRRRHKRQTGLRERFT